MTGLTDSYRNGVVVDPLTVEREIAVCVDQLERGSALLQQLIAAEETAGTNYQIAYAVALLAADEKSAPQREARALVACQDDFRVWQKAKAKVALVKAANHDLRAILDATRSLGTSVRLSYETTVGRPQGSRPNPRRD